ncbi:MAG: flagellar export protein FliJ [Planctomycetales bacterium]|nr:flagellar export protein FliJ [Planctomycetales bacterium]
MAFSFRLATLLKLREAARDERRRQLAQAQEAIAKLDGEQAQIADELASLQDGQRRAASGTVRIDRLIASQRYEASLRISAQTLSEQKRLIMTELEKRQQALIEADRSVKTLEKMREKQFDRWQELELRAEAKQMDEVASRRFAWEM